MEQSLHSDFCIAIDYKKSSKDPTRVFQTLVNLINSFQAFDSDIIGTIGSKIEPVILLEDIESGSVKTWLRTAISSVDDDAMKKLDWKQFVGSYLVKSKYAIIKFLGDKEEITDRKEIEDLKATLFSLAKETDVLHIPSYIPASNELIINSIKSITDAVAPLGPEDALSYEADGLKTSFNLNFRISPESVEELLTKEIIKSNIEMILKIKKPDYLGESMWEFKHDKKSFPAKIMDVQWLKNFQRRKIEIRPGDSIRADVEVAVKYDYNNEVVSTNYALTRVKEIITFDPPSQEPLI